MTATVEQINRLQALEQASYDLQRELKELKATMGLEEAPSTFEHVPEPVPPPGMAGPIPHFSRWLDDRGGFSPGSPQQS